MGPNARAPRAISTTDYHTAGEPFRIVTAGVATARGRTVAERRRWARSHLDVDRTMLCREPRGHADMYGGFLTPPDDDDGDLGVLFFHNDGFSTACGHGTIALATWAVDTGLVTADAGAGELTVVIDVPSGRVRAVVALDERGRPVSVRFRNVPSFVAAQDVEVALADARSAAGLPESVVVDLAYGGAYYATVPAAAVGCRVVADDLPTLIAAGRAIKRAVGAQHPLASPDGTDAGELYGVIFTEPLGDDHQRNVTIFADGQVDRSPCGSGTSARLAVLVERGELDVGATLTHDSIVGTTFLGRVLGPSQAAGGEAARGEAAPGMTRWDTEVTGSAHLTGHHTFLRDPDDPVGVGFVLR